MRRARGSLSMAMAERFTGRALRPAEPAMLIRYAGPAGTFARVSFSDFVGAARAGKSAQVQQWVEGKAVMLGTDLITDTEGQRRLPQPFYAFRVGAPANTAGVEIHANAIWTLLHARPLGRMSAAGVLGAGLGVAIAAALLVFAVTGWALVVSVAALGAACAGAGYALFQAGSLVAPTELALPMLVSLFLSIAYQYFSAARGREALPARGAGVCWAGRWRILWTRRGRTAWLGGGRTSRFYLATFAGLRRGATGRNRRRWWRG